MKTINRETKGEIRLADWTQGQRRSVLQDMLELTGRPGLLSFALGLPAAELFPTAEIGAGSVDILAQDPRALQYGPASAKLRQQIVKLMAQRGVSCEEEQIFLTAGARRV